MSEEEEDPILVDDDLKSRSLGKPILYKSRWHMLTIYSLLAAVNQIVWVCFVVRRFSRSVTFSRNVRKFFNYFNCTGNSNSDGASIQRKYDVSELSCHGISSTVLSGTFTFERYDGKVLFKRYDVDR